VIFNEEGGARGGDKILWADDIESGKPVDIESRMACFIPCARDMDSNEQALFSKGTP
jgi:hypothetical protein